MKACSSRSSARNTTATSRVTPIVEEISQFEEAVRGLSDEAPPEKTAEFRARMISALEGVTDAAERKTIEQDTLTELLPVAYALVRTCRRLCGAVVEVVGIPICGTWWCRPG